MVRLRLNYLLSAVSLMMYSAGAAFACTMVSAEAADAVHNESLFTIRLYHYLSLFATSGVLVIFGLRRWKGWIPLIVSVIAITLSPGWLAVQNAGIDPGCEPSYVIYVKVMFGVVLVCFVVQGSKWKFRKNLP